MNECAEFLLKMSHNALSSLHGDSKMIMPLSKHRNTESAYMIFDFFTQDDICGCLPIFRRTKTKGCHESPLTPQFWCARSSVPGSEYVYPLRHD